MREWQEGGEDGVIGDPQEEEEGMFGGGRVDG